VNASTLVDLLLELNIVNAKDVDSIISKLAARISDPRAQKWFQRVPRFFLINIDRLLKEPYVAKAEPRGMRGSKYYADPRGGWIAGRQPEIPKGNPLPVREQYDPEKQTYTTALHEPVVQKDIEQSFAKFKPAKAKAKRMFGEPPVKKELQPWMTAPGAEEKEFYHFDPIQTGRRELFSRLTNLVHYLNYQHSLIARAAIPEGEMDDQERANALEAEKLMRKLEVMKTDDIASFRDVMKEGGDFMDKVKDKPWFFTKDGKTIAQHGNLTLRKAIYPETVVAFSKRNAATGELPVWCTKALSYATTYSNQGPLYFIDKDDKPYVLAHWPTHQVYNVQDSPLNDRVVHEIAPLFVDPDRFPTADIASGSQALANEVSRLRSQRLRGPER
jgi:hypothetical protein